MPNNSKANMPNMADEEQSPLSSLIQTLSTILRNLHSIKQRTACEKVDSDTHVDSYFQHICDVQNNIEALSPSDKSRAEVEETTKSEILSLINPRNRVSELNTSIFNATAFGNASHHNRLPSLKLPKFDRKYVEYKRFFRTFCNIVHDDPTMPKVTEENYLKALQRLKERYDNNVMIFQDHIISLFNNPFMKRSDAVSLRNIIDNVAALRGSLLSSGSEGDIMNSVLIHIALTKIDYDSKSAHNQKQEFDCLPSWDDCYKWLNRHCQYLETCSNGENSKVTQQDCKLVVIS
nr:uncharacterized protein LOC106625320 [Bactrocera oleae]